MHASEAWLFSRKILAANSDNLYALGKLIVSRKIIIYKKITVQRLIYKYAKEYFNFTIIKIWQIFCPNLKGAFLLNLSFDIIIILILEYNIFIIQLSLLPYKK